MLAPLLAAALVLRPPLGPDAEAQGKALALPFALGSEVAGGSHLWHLEVQPRALRYGLGPMDDTVDAWVIVRLEPGAPPQITTQGDGARGPAARRFVETLRHNLRNVRVDGDVSIRLTNSTQRDAGAAPAPNPEPRAPPRADPDAGRPPPSPPFPPRAGELRLLWGGLLVLALLLALSRETLGEVTPSPPWLLLLGGTGAVAVAGALAPDVLAYQSSHGIAWAEAVGASVVHENHDVFGFTALGLDRLLGALAPAGREAFGASRIAWVLLVPTAYAAAATLSRRSVVGIVAAALLVTDPSVAFLGRAAFPTVPGLLWAALTLWLVVAAARRPEARLVLAASLALAVLASFRAMGPVAAPLVVAVGVGSAWAHRSRRLSRFSPRLLAALVVGGLLVATVEFVQGTRLLVTATATRVGLTPLSPSGVLFLAPHWEPLMRGALALAGGVTLARSRVGFLGALVVFGWIALTVWLTRGSVDTWSNLPRYQAWVLLPADYLGALGLVAMGRALRRVWLGPAWVRAAVGLLAAAVLAAWGAGEVRALRNATLEHPEAVNLALWRVAVEALPTRAELVLPREPVGASSAAYPLVELARRRPGVDVWRSDQLAQASATGRPVYRFDPLFCHVAYREAPPPGDVDCVTLPRRRTWEPVVVREVRAELPDLLAEVGYPLERWMLLPLTTPKAELGLYRLVR